MQPQRHLLATCSVLLIAALLAACAAPAATPAPPTATPVPPTPAASPMDVARAYESAWNTFDAAAVTALFAEPFNTDYGFPMTDKKAWSEGWPYGMARGMGMRIALHDCEVSGDTVTCKVASQSPCFTMDVIEALTVQDGKITKLEHREIPAEDARWEAYSTAVEEWAEQQGLDEWQAYSDEVAKGTYGYDWGAAFVSLCQQYEAAGQAQDPAATIQSWLDALNTGDLDAALALMTPDARISGAFTDPPPDVLKWWIDIREKHGVPNCQAEGDKFVCNVMMSDDGCIAASGNTAGLPVRYTFGMKDDHIHRVFVEALSTPEWDAYWQWLGTEMTWARLNRADDMAQIDFEHQTRGGDSAVKLCQEYAALVEKQMPVITAAAQGWANAINSGDMNAALAFMSDDAKFGFWHERAIGMDQLVPMFQWLAGRETKYQLSDCKWQLTDIQCALSAVDGCIAAYGALDGLPGKMTFASQEDGMLSKVNGFLETGGRTAYETWLEAETAWASANRADELAQAEGYSNAAGEMAVQLCQEYAETLK